MKRSVSGCVLGVALLALSVTAAGAREVTVDDILTMHEAGAPANGIVAVVKNPTNALAMTAEDLDTLRDAGLQNAVIDAVHARLPSRTPTSMPLVPDDTRLLDLVRLVDSGISSAIIAEQVKQSSQVYDLSVNDLLYLKQHGAQDSTITALMATGAGALTAPGTAGVSLASTEIVFEGLSMKTGFLRKNRIGRLVIRGDTVAWVDSRDPGKNVSFKTAGVEKVWLTCQAQSPENFCHQINFQIVKGDRYRFQDVDRESGSNAAVLELMDAMRTYFPRLAFGAADNG